MSNSDYRPGDDGEPVKRSTPLKPIAREGETEFASIHRNRSGHDAGCIDFGIRVSLIEDLSPAEKGELARTSQAMNDAIQRYCGKK